MTKRIHKKMILQRLATSPAVALLGSRQVGKTTLAKGLGSLEELDFDKKTHYLDLERPSDLAKLADPELYLSRFKNQLIIIDEIQVVPELFPVLRSLIDERRQAGERSAQFLLLGSASPELIQHSAETLAGRISYLELPPFLLTEISKSPKIEIFELEKHWFRGGYPDAYLAESDDVAQQWAEDFITSYIERYLPQLGAAASPIFLRRLCTMLAHQQGGLLNLSKLSGSLGMDAKTIRSYIDQLEGLYLIRSLPAYATNLGKRLVKSAKTYWRDSGVLHSLAGLGELEKVLEHPLCGASWEGYCIEQIINHLPSNVRASHYRTHAGAEVDLVLEYPDGETHALEIKRTLSPKISRGFTESFATLQASKGFYIIPRGDSFPMNRDTIAIGLGEYLASVQA